MTTAEYDGEDSASEVMQDDAPERVVVPVAIEGHAHVRELPALGAGATVLTLDTNGARVLAADPKRKFVTLVSRDQDIYVGTRSAQVDIRNTAGAAGTPSGAWWPANVPLVIGHCDEIWVSSASSTTRLSVLPERWTR